MSLTPHSARWLDAMLAVARHYGIGVSEEGARVALAWEQGASADLMLLHMAKSLGLALRFGKLSLELLDAWRLPLVAEFDDGSVCVVQTIDGEGNLGVLFSGDKGLETRIGVEEFRQHVRRVAILRPQVAVPDARVDQYIRPYRRNWFWNIALRDWKRYGDVMLASLVANVLALAGVIFSMQVYDRVVPANSEATLWVLFGGVMLAIVFEFCLRVSRTHISDTVGKRADLRISDVVFGRALRLRNSARSRSTGTFISQLREIDQVRELFTSTTVGALADLPFFLLFLVVLWMVGGPLMFVALGAIPLLVIPGLLIQKPLERLSNEGMRESALRNAMLVEAVQGIEDIKLLRAEARFQNQWNNVNDVSAGISMRQRFLTSLLMSWTQEVQGIVYALVLALGSYLVMQGDMTTGALVASSILASRMISPLAQMASVFSRWQSAKVARKGLDELMSRPVDQPERARRVHRAALNGNYQLDGVSFRYGDNDKRPALVVPQLQIRAGEKIAILGRIGSGKSTLLNLLSGMHSPQEGRVSLDGLDLAMIDTADVRRDMAMLPQSSRLFYGTIRENILLGAPMASDAMITQALSLSGALSFVQALPDGLDEVILEGGQGLSGGQRQTLLLARTLIRNPSVVLLDEPTANFDEMTERQVIDAMGPWMAPRTLVVATHRMPVLKWVDRIILIDNGRVVLDGPKDKVLKELTQ